MAKDLILSGSVTAALNSDKKPKQLGSTEGHYYQQVKIGNTDLGKTIVPTVIHDFLQTSSTGQFGVITQMTPDGYSMILSAKSTEGEIIVAEGFNAFNVLNPIWFWVTFVVALIVVPPGLYYSYQFFSFEPIGFSGSILGLLYAERWFFITSQLSSGRKSFTKQHA